MVRHWFRYGSVAAAAIVLGSPAGLRAQECAEHGNQHTRGADVELSYAARRDDPQPKETRYARAIEKLEPTLSDEDPLPRAYLLAGEAYLGLRDFQGADSMLTKLMAVQPECADLVNELRFNAWVPLYNMGINSLRAGDDEAALAAFLQANVIFTDARSLTNAGNLYQKKGDDTAAMEMYAEALDVGGEPEMLRAASINMAELLRREGRDDEALTIYSEYAAANPDDVLGTLNYAIALMDSGDQESAEQIFSQLLTRDDLSFRQWSQVGIGLYRARDFAQAAVAFERAHEMSPLNKETMENLANTYYQAERYQELLPIARELTQRYPNESVNYNLLANAERELGDADGALSALQQRDALKFEFLRSQLVSVSEGVYSVEGQVMDKAGAAGSDVTVSVQLLGEEGQVIASDDLLITLPGEGETTSFSLQFEVGEPVAGFQYSEAGS